MVVAVFSQIFISFPLSYSPPDVCHYQYNFLECCSWWQVNPFDLYSVKPIKHFSSDDLPNPSWLGSFHNLLILPWGLPSLYSQVLPHLHPPCVSQVVFFDHCPINTFLKSLGVVVRLHIIVQVSSPH